MSRISLLLGPCTAMCLAAAANAQAPDAWEMPQAAPEQRFGLAGQLLLAGSIGGWMEVQEAGAERQQGGYGLPPQEVVADWQVHFSPRVAHFVFDDLALGVGVELAYGEFDSYLFPRSVSAVGARIGLGYNLPVGPGASLFPLAWASVGHEWYSYEYEELSDGPLRSGTQTGGDVTFKLTLDPALHVEVGNSAFVYVGPTFYWEHLLDHGSRSGFTLAVGIGRFW